jgi:hypothetical protein
MGFSLKDAEKSLIYSGYNEERAIHLLTYEE